MQRRLALEARVEFQEHTASAGGSLSAESQVVGSMIARSRLHGAA